MGTPILAVTILPFLAASACSGDSSSDLVGTWLDRDDRDGAVVAEVTFAEDGTLTVQSPEDGGDTFTGTFEADGDQLALDIEIDGDRIAYSAGYHSDGQVLLIPAYLPVGSVDGFAGTWRAEVTVSEGNEAASEGIDTLILRADGTASRNKIDEGEVEPEQTGTWSEGSNWISVEFTDGNSRTWFGLPGAGLTEDPLFRAE